MIFRRAQRQPSEQPQEPTPGATPYAFHTDFVRLYHPDEEMDVLLAGNVSALAAYIKTLQWVLDEFFRRSPPYPPMGLLVAAALQPDRSRQCWVEPAGGALSTDVLEALVPLLQGAGEEVVPEVTGPVRFAINGRLGNGTQREMPQFPRAWRPRT